MPELTFSVLAVLFTAINRHWQAPFSFTSWGSSLDLPRPSLDFGLFGLTWAIISFLHLIPISHLALPLDTQHLLGIFMSSRTQDDEVVELSCKIGELEVTIKGPAEPAVQLFHEIAAKGHRRASSPAASTDCSFSLVSGYSPLQVPAASAKETRDQIRASFEVCPAYLVNQGSKLSGSASTSGADRVRRAWLAGQWAEATAQGRTSTPNCTQQLDLRSRFYAVFKAPGLDRPVIFKSAKSYWALVGELRNSSSISHAFPSEQEARIYLAGAGVVDFDIKP